MSMITYRRTRANRPTMNRAEIMRTIASLRRLRDQCRREGGTFARGMAAGYQLSALILWRDYLESNR